MKKRLRKKYGISLIVSKVESIDFSNGVVVLSSHRQRLARGFRLPRRGVWPPPETAELQWGTVGGFGNSMEIYARP